MREESFEMQVYRVTSPTLALALENGQYVAQSVPTGSLISIVDNKPFDGEMLMSVMWAGVKVMMLTYDLRKHTEMVNEPA